MAFVLGLAPGVLLAVTGVELRQDPGLVLAGAVWCLIAVLARHRSEPRFLAAEVAPPFARRPSTSVLPEAPR